MVAAAAWEGNLEDSDHVVEAFTILNAGMWGRAGQREQSSGSLKHWEGKYTNGTLIRKEDGGGAGHLEQAGIKEERQISFAKENKKIEILEVAHLVNTCILRWYKFQAMENK